MKAFSLRGRRGDHIRLEVVVSRNGEPLDVGAGGVSLWFTAKTSIAYADDDPTTIRKTLGSGIVILDGAAGKVLVTLDPSDTADLVADTVYTCDIQLKEADNTITTIASGILLVVLDVTRA